MQSQITCRKCTLVKPYRRPTALVAPCRRSRRTAVLAQQQQLATTQERELDNPTDHYNAQMHKQMGWSNPYDYHFDRGLYMHEVSPGLVCGTQPRNPDEIKELVVKHGINVIVNLQQDKDIEYWGIDFAANQRKCHELGVQLVRRPVGATKPYARSCLSLH
eukprot:GHRR01002455.1.p1 GENE.GHRR01002455.1~~GHRR01002455.1.p1  ORF type:complete len:161 (+),score=14.69 GHRR01002455.1:176-658(+)